MGCRRADLRRAGRQRELVEASGLLQVLHGCGHLGIYRAAETAERKENRLIDITDPTQLDALMVRVQARRVAQRYHGLGAICRP